MIKPNWCPITKKQKRVLQQIEEDFMFKEGASLFTPILKMFVNTHLSDKRLNHQFLLIELKDHLEEINENCGIYKVNLEKKRKRRINTFESRRAFIKQIPLIDLGQTGLYKKVCNTPHLCKNSHFLIYQNLYSLNNPAYIEQLCSYLTSQLVEKEISPHFPLYFGSFFGIKKEFVYVVDKLTPDVIKTIPDDYQVVDKNSKGTDYSVAIKNIPTQILATEDAGFELVNLIDLNNYSIDTYKSVCFQVIAALHLIYNRFNLTHNDLHIGNIMCKPTKKEFIYYKGNNSYYKVPTNGIIVKIIDWGRGMLQISNKLIWNNVFSEDGQAGEQYTEPLIKYYIPKNKRFYKTNRHFDMAIFSFSLLKRIRSEIGDIEGPFIDFLENNCRLKHGGNLYKRYVSDNRFTFETYLHIRKYSKYTNPTQLIKHTIFKDYKQEKEDNNLKYYLLE